ncbi:hypothetical protein KCP74_06165 [Salmonella enterica subsp. enterica]|nr:hypothetical protein KCP74_06165 [Salmonella enterica subsp. enterica]
MTATGLTTVPAFCALFNFNAAMKEQRGDGTTCAGGHYRENEDANSIAPNDPSER